MCQLCWFILFSHCNTQRSIINPAHMFDIKHDKRRYLLTEMFLQKVQILWYFIRSQQTAKVWIFLISTILFIITPTRRTLETDETRELFVGEMRVRCQVSATGECKLSWEWHCDTDWHCHPSQLIYYLSPASAYTIIPVRPPDWGHVTAPDIRTQDVCWACVTVYVSFPHGTIKVIAEANGGWWWYSDLTRL